MAIIGLLRPMLPTLEKNMHAVKMSKCKSTHTRICSVLDAFEVSSMTAVVNVLDLFCENSH